MADVHVFNVGVATKYGVNAAILLWNISFWIEKNAANDKHFYDGRYWTYNSVSAMEKLFPYMSAKSIRYTIDKLVSDGLIVKGNYNEQQYDRTNWYALTNKGMIVCQKGQMDLPKRANGFAENGEPIPYSYPDSSTDTSRTEAAASGASDEKKSGKRFAETDKPYRAAKWLSRAIMERMPKRKPITEDDLQRWASDIDKLHRIDGYDDETISDVLIFSQRDAFWQSNILSGKKFREKFVTLMAHMEREARKQSDD